jgi:hypothetical protein
MARNERRHRTHPVPAGHAPADRPRGGFFVPAPKGNDMSLADHMQSLSDRKLPVALLGAFAIQTAGALFWAGSAAERITVLEHIVAEDQSATARVAVLEEQVGEMKQSLERIETKLDRVNAEEK